MFLRFPGAAAVVVLKSPRSPPAPHKDQQRRRTRFGMVGCTMTRPTCSDFLSPMFVQVFPPFSTCRRHRPRTSCAGCWPHPYRPRGCQDCLARPRCRRWTPSLVIEDRLPGRSASGSSRLRRTQTQRRRAHPAFHRLRLGPSGTAKSTTRPLVTAGPMERHGSSASRAESASNTAGVVLAVRAAWATSADGRDNSRGIARTARENDRGIILWSEESG